MSGQGDEKQRGGWGRRCAGFVVSVLHVVSACVRLWWWRDRCSEMSRRSRRDRACMPDVDSAANSSRSRSCKQDGFPDAKGEGGEGGKQRSGGLCCVRSDPDCRERGRELLAALGSGMVGRRGSLFCHPSTTSPLHSIMRGIFGGRHWQSRVCTHHGFVDSGAEFSSPAARVVAAEKLSGIALWLLRCVLETLRLQLRGDTCAMMTRDNFWARWPAMCCPSFRQRTPALYAAKILQDRPLISVK